MPPIPKPKPKLQPYWTTSDGSRARFYLGNTLDVLHQLPSQSVQEVVTSPPYWGLRSYLPEDHELKQYEIGNEPSPDCGTQGQAQCGRCFVCSMVGVFREVRRVLRDDGTLWLNLGDSYSGGSGGRGDSGNEIERADGTLGKTTQKHDGKRIPRKDGLPSGNLVGVPWRVALALQADGWVLRQDIIWAKPSPMPESIRNRCTKAHEYVFLLTKRGSGYYYDAEAIKTPAVPAERVISGKSGSYGQALAKGVKPSGNGVSGSVMRTGNTSNKRSVWTVDTETTFRDWVLNNVLEGEEMVQAFFHASQNRSDVWRVPSQGYDGAHFATYPPNLIRPAIRAGTSRVGCCRQCGTPWKRIVEEEAVNRERPNDYVKRTGEEGTGNSCPNSAAGVRTRTLGWEAGCGCGLPQSENVPCVVLDPFLGSGTTCEVALEEMQSCWGIDLNEDFLKKNAIVRVEGFLFSRPALAHLARRERKALLLGTPTDVEG